MALTRWSVASFLLRISGGQWIVSKILDLSDAGHISVAEARCLSRLVAHAPAFRPIVEIGTLFGTSTRALAVGKPRETPLLSIDNYSWNPLFLGVRAHKRYTQCRWADLSEDYHVDFVDMDRLEFYAGYSGLSPFLFFADAIHTYQATREDLRWAIDAGADLICSHDYDSQNWPGVVRAVDEIGEVTLLIDSLAVQARTPLGHEVIQRIKNEV